MNLLRRAATTAAVCLALPALAACSDGEATPEVADPTTPAVVTPTETPTEPPEPVEPELPEAATKKSKGGAVAFVQHYWDMVAYAQDTGDTEGLERLAGPFCDACEGGLNWIRDVHDAGGRISGGVTTTVDSSVEILRTQEGQDGHFVTVTVHNTRQVVKRPGKKREVFAGGTGSKFKFAMSFQEDGWLIGFWEPVE